MHACKAKFTAAEFPRPFLYESSDALGDERLAEEALHLAGAAFGIPTGFVFSSLETQRWTRPEPLPPMRASTSCSETMLKSCSMVCFRHEAATANSMQRWAGSFLRSM